LATFKLVEAGVALENVVNHPGIRGDSIAWKEMESCQTTLPRRGTRQSCVSEPYAWWPKRSTTRAVSASGWITRIARQLGVGTESLRNWVNQAEIDGGRRVGTTTEDSVRIPSWRRRCASGGPTRWRVQAVAATTCA
jgi:hypothetical protein